MVPFTFAIPLRSRAASSDWRRVCRLLDATLRSILAQTDAAFHVLVAHHEVPSVSVVGDSRVTFVRAECAVPTTFEEQMRDKAYKRRLLAAEVRRRGAGFYMPVDSDDLVSRRLVAYAREHDDAHGYLFRDGYQYNVRTHRFRARADFDLACGTCAIFRLEPSDLPESVDSPERTLLDEFTGHQLWREQARELDRPMAPLPFPGAMYCVANGENHSMRSGNARHDSRLSVPPVVMRLVNGLSPARRVPADVRAEFGLDVTSGNA